jgi:hypothetical protein
MSLETKYRHKTHQSQNQKNQKNQKNQNALNIIRPGEIILDEVLFKKRISIGQGIYEYPIVYSNNNLILQTSTIYIPYSTYKIESKITFDFFFLNLEEDKDMYNLYNLVNKLDKKVINKINIINRQKSSKKKRRSPKRDFISNIKKNKSKCMTDKPHRMRVSLYDTTKVFNEYGDSISISNLKGKSYVKLLLSPTKIWVNKSKYGIFWEVLQVKIYQKLNLNRYMFQDTLTCNCPCNCKHNNLEKRTNTYESKKDYAIYFDMLRKGVPKQAVKNKMIMENKDPSILDEKRESFKRNSSLESESYSDFNLITYSNSNSNPVDDEYILVNGVKLSAPPPPPPPPPAPNMQLNISEKSKKQPSGMSVVFNELLSSAQKLKNITEKDKNKFRKKKISKSNSRSKLCGSYTPSLNEIVNMRSSLKKTISIPKMDYLRLD